MTLFVILMSNYPPGAANDSSAPYNEPLTRYSNIIVEATADISAIIEVEVEVDEDGYPILEDLQEAVKKAFIKRFNIENVDNVLNDIHIWGWRFK